MKGEYEGISGEEEENTHYGGMVQPSQQHGALCVKGVKLGLNRRGWRMVAAFWAGIQVEVTKETGVWSNGLLPTGENKLGQTMINEGICVVLSL